MSKIHVVNQGDHLPNIAEQHGFVDWRTIYDHPSNADFRTYRSNPHVLLPGDRICIPEKPIKTVDCAVDQTHEFQLDVPKIMLRIVLKDHEDKPLRDAPYTLVVNQVKHDGYTDRDGLLQHSIPATTESVELGIGGVTWELLVGHLDPTDNSKEPVVTGVQARLQNLGFYAGKIDGELGPKSHAAIKRFQQTHMKRENADGKLDSDTLTTLLQRHGC
jgi:putative peptidoglycan binding protein